MGNPNADLGKIWIQIAKIQDRVLRFLNETEPWAHPSSPPEPLKISRLVRPTNFKQAAIAMPYFDVALVLVFSSIISNGRRRSRCCSHILAILLCLPAAGSESSERCCSSVSIKFRLIPKSWGAPCVTRSPAGKAVLVSALRNTSARPRGPSKARTRFVSSRCISPRAPIF